MSPHHRPLVRSASLLLLPADDGYLSFDVRALQLHRQNPAASLILELCDGTRTPHDIVDALEPFLPDRSATAAWIQQAMHDGWIECDDAARAPALSAPNLTQLARSQRREGSVLSAYVCQEAAMALDPDTAAGWSALGELAHILGRRDRAREAYTEYLRRVPHDAEVEQILIALNDGPPPSRAPDRCITQLYARFAEFYEKNMCDDLDYQAPQRLAEVLDAHLGTAAPMLDVLDLGCGTGLAAPALRPRAHSLVGVDLSPEMVAQATATGAYDELAVAEITRWLTEDPREYDLIVAADTLIYFGDLAQVCRPVARRLRPGGLLAFTLERGTKPPFHLTDSGRYAHTAQYIRDTAADAGLAVLTLTEGFLRREYGDDVVGLVVALRKPSTR